MDSRTPRNLSDAMQDKDRSPPVTCPPLLIELAEFILAIALQRAAVTSRWNPGAMARPLNAVTRSAAPLVTKVALVHLPHVDLDRATALNNADMLRFMLTWSLQPDGRPVQYLQPITLGMRAGAMAALDWWMDESGLCFKWHEDVIEQACALGNIHFLEWWASRGYPHFDPLSQDQAALQSMRTCVCSATTNGHDHVLDWLLEHIPRSVFDKAHEWSIMEKAAESGQRAVLDWWTTFGMLSMSSGPSLAEVLVVAFRDKHLQVLEWCKSHPQVAQQYQQEQASNPYLYMDTLSFAIRSQLYDWIDSLGVIPSMFENRFASSQAAKACDIRALEWLLNKGYLLGSLVQLTSDATSGRQPGSTTLETLRWIHQHFDDSAHSDGCPPEPHRHDPYFGACINGDVAVLDWLWSQGYRLNKTYWDRYFIGAGMGDHVSALDWLLPHTGMLESEFQTMGFSCLNSASIHSSISVLEWWKQRLPVSTLSLTGHARQPLSPSCSVEVVDWWLNRAGPLSNHFGLEGLSHCCCLVGGELQGCDCSPNNCSVLWHLWLSSGRSLDYAACINAASVRGNVDGLDWLLTVAKAPRAAFVKAFTSAEYTVTGSPFRYNDSENHGASLLWWWANVPEVCNSAILRINRGRYSNPIVLYILKRMLKLAHYSVDGPIELSYQGHVAMLQYLSTDKIHHVEMTTQLEWSLEVASKYNQYHCLEWWKSRSGFEVICPKGVEEGRVEIGQGAKSWWLASGLCRSIADAEYPGPFGGHNGGFGGGIGQSMGYVGSAIPHM